jgi:hypothetical protein
MRNSEACKFNGDLKIWLGLKYGTNQAHYQEQSGGETDATHGAYPQRSFAEEFDKPSVGLRDAFGERFVF